MQFWDYSLTKCDVNGRICLPFSICWGILSMLAVRVWCSRFWRAMPHCFQSGAAALAVFLVTLDGILTGARPAHDARYRRFDAANVAPK